MTSHSEEGRYIKVKLKNEEQNFEYTMSNIYIEPEKENKFNEIIPTNIFESDTIAGDLNKAKTDYTKIYNVYHIKNIGEQEKKLM